MVATKPSLVHVRAPGDEGGQRSILWTLLVRLNGSYSRCVARSSLVVPAYSLTYVASDCAYITSDHCWSTIHRRDSGVGFGESHRARVFQPAVTIHHGQT